MDALENHIQVVKHWVWAVDGIRIDDFISIREGSIYKTNYHLTYAFMVTADNFETAITIFRTMTKLGAIESITKAESN